MLGLTQRFTLNQGLCIHKAEAIYLVLHCPVVQAVHDELAHTGMAAVEHAIMAIISGSIEPSQG